MAKPRAGFSARPVAAAAGRASPASDPNLPTPTSIPRADLSSVAKAAVASANRSSVGSSSSAPASDLPAPAARDVASVVKEVGKRLSYDDEDDDGAAFPAAASGMKKQMGLVPEGLADLAPLLDLPDPDDACGMKKQMELVPEGLADLAPLLDLPDPDDASSTTTVLSASAADATNASAESTVTQVAAPADSTTTSAGAEGPVLTEMELVLAELHGSRGLSPRSKRLLVALAETASAELSHNPTASALRMRRANFWRKVCVGILAATVFSVTAMDVALAFVLYDARRSNALYSHVLTPT